MVGILTVHIWAIYTISPFQRFNLTPNMAQYVCTCGMIGIFACDVLDVIQHNKFFLLGIFIGFNFQLSM